jgi:hypothetical protein
LPQTAAAINPAAHAPKASTASTMATAADSHMPAI